MSDEPIHTAPTLFLAQYNGQTVVPLDRVCRDFFGHLTVEKLLRKALRGDIALPIVRIKKHSGAFILSIWQPISTNVARQPSRNAISCAVNHGVRGEYDCGTTQARGGA
jgi:hypothetical protein